MTNLMDNSRSKALCFRRRAALDSAVSAALARGYWSPYPEIPSRKRQSASAARDGEAALTDLAFIADRRAIVQSRREIA